MSNCCMRRPAKFHVDSAVRFLSYREYSGGGALNAPPPGQARVKERDGAGPGREYSDFSLKFERTRSARNKSTYAL